MYADRYRPCTVLDVQTPVTVTTPVTTPAAARVADGKTGGKKDVKSPKDVKTPDAAAGGKRGKKAGGKPGKTDVLKDVGKHVERGVVREPPSPVREKAAAAGPSAGQVAGVDEDAKSPKDVNTSSRPVDASAGLLTPAMLAFAFNRGAIACAMPF